MSPGVVVWLIIALVSAMLFFGIAGVVTVFGGKDLWKFLKRDDEAPRPAK